MILYIIVKYVTMLNIVICNLIHLNIYIYVTVRVSNQGFSQIPKTFRESVKFLFHSRIRSLNVYGYD